MSPSRSTKQQQPRDRLAANSNHSNTSTASSQSGRSRSSTSSSSSRNSKRGRGGGGDGSGSGSGGNDHRQQQQQSDGSTTTQHHRHRRSSTSPKRKHNILNITTSSINPSSLTNAVESVVLTPMNGLTSAVREVLLATEDALSTAGETITSAVTSPTSSLKGGRSTTFSFSSSSSSNKNHHNRLSSVHEEYDADATATFDEDDDDEKKSESGDHPHKEPPAINIRHYQNGTAEVELVTDESSPIMQSQTKRGSFAYDSEDGNGGRLMTMNLRVLRAKGIPFNTARVTIHILDDPNDVLTDNDDECFETDVDGRPVFEKTVGCTATAHCPSGAGNVIWGGPVASWTVRGTESSKFVFVVEDAATDAATKSQQQQQSTKSPSTSQTINNSSNEIDPSSKSRICVKVFAVDLLNGGAKHSPNCWLRLRDYGPAGLQDCGLLEVRLIKTPDATLHQQENCHRISPGPNFPRMQSYAIRKMALYSVSPVMLNVYDVSNNPRIQTINNATKPLGYGGIFHAAIEIHGREYSFGGTLNKKSQVSGIFASVPKRCPMHHYRESVYLGDCELDSKQIQIILDIMRPQWKARTYNLFRKNCAFFSRELAVQLGVGDIPGWVWSLAATAEKFEPTLLQINSYLTRPRRSTKTSSPKNDKSSSASTNRPEHDVKKVEQVVAAVLQENDSDRQGLNAASSTQENLLDHAMAARIQRSFRAVSERNMNLKRSARFRTSKTMDNLSSRTEMSM